MAHTTRSDLLEHVKRYLAKAIRERGGPGSAEFAAWEEFFELYNEILWRFATSLRLPDDEADDLVQEVWGDVIRLLPKFEYDRAKGGFRRWLYRIVKSKAIDAARRRSVRRMNRSASEHVTAVLDELPDPKAADPADDDILIAGWLDFAARETAISKIMAEWTSDRDYRTRIENISGVGSGPRTNDGYFLLLDSTVRDDEEASHDVLTGKRRRRLVLLLVFRRPRHGSQRRSLCQRPGLDLRWRLMSSSGLPPKSTNRSNS